MAVNPIFMCAVTIKDLARELQLSMSTVSRALRDSHEISQLTKQKVFELARQLNFQPNPNASSLRDQKTKTIAVVIPEVANNFFSLVLNGIEKAAQELNYHVLIYLTHENAEREASYLNCLINGRVDGILLSLSSETKSTGHIEAFNTSKIPLVLFDRVSDEVGNCKVTTDDRKSSFEGTMHLIEMGCQKIAFLMFSPFASIGKMRYAGYSEAIANKGEQAELLVECGNDPHENYLKIEALLKNEKPDGVFASVEKLAVSTYQVCADLKINIPRKLKVLSFSNLDTAPLLAPALSTIKQPAFDIGETAARLLIRKINGKGREDETSHIIESTLVKRRSTE